MFRALLAPLVVVGLAAGAPCAHAQCVVGNGACIPGFGEQLEIGLGAFNGRPGIVQRLGFEAGGYGLGVSAFLGPFRSNVDFAMSIEGWRTLWQSGEDRQLVIQMALGGALSTASQMQTIDPVVGLNARLDLGAVYMAVRPRVQLTRVRAGPDLFSILPTPVFELTFGLSGESIFDDTCGEYSPGSRVVLVRPP